jgi:hypothetical protein
MGVTSAGKSRTSLSTTAFIHPPFVKTACAGEWLVLAVAALPVAARGGFSQKFSADQFVHSGHISKPGSKYSVSSAISGKVNG